MSNLPKEMMEQIALARALTNTPVVPSMITIKAIETKFRGYRFRSRTEARWAVFFDALHIKWLYEHEGFDLNGLCYLPDFWLPEYKCFVEIKGQILNDTDREKVTRLSVASGKPVVVIEGVPGLEKIECFAAYEPRLCIHGETNLKWKYGCHGHAGIGPMDPDEIWIGPDCNKDWCSGHEETREGMDYPYSDELRRACNLSRTERFGT